MQVRNGTRAALGACSLSAAALLALSACGSSGGGSAAAGSTGASTGASTAAAAPQTSMSDMPPMTSMPAAAAPTTAQQAPGGGTTITVTETEFKLDLDTSSVPAGPVTFDVKNAGTIVHALSIDGPGVEDKATMTIQPGKTATLTVTMKKGSYDVYCPVGDHKMEGMDTHVTVG